MGFGKFATSVLGGVIGALIGGPVGAVLGAGIGYGVGEGVEGIAEAQVQLEREERRAKMRTDPFLEEKRQAIRQLMMMSPYLPDVSKSHFLETLQGIEPSAGMRQSSVIEASGVNINPALFGVAGIPMNVLPVLLQILQQKGGKKKNG